MIALISYYTFLLLIIIFYLYLFFENVKRSPKKFKRYISIFLFLGIIKNMFVFFMSLLSFQVDIKIAKIIIFIDLLYIPVLIILLSYIFLRSDNMDFKYIKIKMGIVGAIYTCVIIIFEPIYKLSIEYGYTVQMSKNILFRGIYISLFVYFLIHAILVKLNKSTNMIGLNFIAITMCVFIFENLVLLVVQNYMPYCLVGELFLAGTLIFGLKTFKS